MKLARCVVATLRSGGKIGMGSGLVIQKSPSGETRIERWDKDFIEALAFIGIEVVDKPKSKLKTPKLRPPSALHQENRRRRST